MKIALAAATGLVFAALWLFDTQALIRLTAACVTGECGVHPAWFAGAAALLAAGTVVFGRRPPPESGTKPGIARTTARPPDTGEIHHGPFEKKILRHAGRVPDHIAPSSGIRPLTRRARCLDPPRAGHHGEAATPIAHRRPR